MLYRARVTVFRQLMALQRHSLRSLGARAGCSHVTVWAVSSGRKSCHLELATRIADELGVSVEDLFFTQRVR